MMLLNLPVPEIIGLVNAMCLSLAKKKRYMRMCINGKVASE
jgi:hypothetical protein